MVARDTWEALRWYLGATLDRPQFVNIDFPDRPGRAKLLCAICRAEQRSLDLHEEWHYDDKRKIQRLVHLRPICRMCHLSKHLGYANTAGRIDEALAHLAAVNAWMAQQAKEYSVRVFAMWEKRSSTTYEIDVSYLERHIPPTKIHKDWLDNPRTWIGSRLDAIIWASRLLDSDAIILDTETTGLLSYEHVEVIELAAVNMKGKQVYQSLFKPLYKIPKEVIKIHHIASSRCSLPEEGGSPPH